MLTNTGSEQFVNGFMAGQMGLDIPEDATEEFIRAYARGCETAERETALSEYMQEKMK